jgi:2-hydroxy-6-oxonona-2,4-dienedioate hydrolase
LNSIWVELLHSQVRLVQGKYRTRIIEAGEGEPLLLLHGTGGHAENYARNIAPLAKQFRVVALDFLWHGRSQTEGFDPEVIPALVDQVRDVMDLLGLERAQIEGQSLGGWVAMRFALAHPSRVRKLVITTPMGYRPDAGTVPGYAEGDPAPLRENTLAVLREPTMANVRKRMERIVHDPSLVTDEAVAVRHAFYNDPAVNAVQQRLTTHYLGGPEPQRHVVTDADAARIAAPSLVYWGERNVTPPALGERLASVIPGAAFFCAPGVGHWAQFEKFDIHNREVSRFLSA